ncbi:MAG: phage holin family protein [Bryobacteraceae bacterium]
MEDSGKTAAGAMTGFAYSSRAERSTSDLVRDIIGNVQEMVRSEVRLAKAELREEVGKTVSGAKMLGIAAVAGIFALGFVLVALTLLLALVMPSWAATMIMGTVLAITAGVAFGKGQGQLKLPKPEKTIENVKENVQWMKDQTKS